MAAVAYQLKSELARVCLPAPERDAYRRLAWVNSLCLLFLLIGSLGAQYKLPVPKHAPPIEQPVPVVVEPLPPPAPVPKPVERPNEEEKPKPQPSVAVTLDTPAINFAVPTIGTLVVPLSAAPTPPAADFPKPTRCATPRLPSPAPARRATAQTALSADGLANGTARHGRSLVHSR